MVVSKVVKLVIDGQEKNFNQLAVIKQAIVSSTLSVEQLNFSPNLATKSALSLLIGFNPVIAPLIAKTPLKRPFDIGDTI